jgi:arginyl-tRNA synthetase
MRPDLTRAATDVLQSQFGLADIALTWEFPSDIAHGDFATAVALRAAKLAGKPPRVIAEAIAGALKALPDVAKVDVAGAGYVNVWLTPGALVALLTEPLACCSPKPLQKVPPVIIDYPSPNIAKPLGVHHILVATIGQVLANLERHAGHPVVGWNYIGDWGTQFGKLAVAHAKWGAKPVGDCSVDELLTLYVKFHDEAERTPTLEEEGRAAFRKLEQGDATLRTFLDTVTEVSLREMKVVFDRLGVHFDLVRGERTYEEKMAPIVEEGKKKNVFVPGEHGALIVMFPEATKMPPAIVLKSDGATIYLTRDLALMRDRIDGWHPSAILHVVGVAQSLYFQQLFATAKQLQWDLPHLEHVAFGQMRFTDQKMSTRKGNIIKLDAVLDEAVTRAAALIAERGDAIQSDDPKQLAEIMGVGALVYAIVSQNRKLDIVFDWDKMLSFEGNSAPYLQYTYARARSVVRKADLKSVPAFSKDITTLTTTERALVLHLLRFPTTLDEARTSHMPHTLANFLYGLCQHFNAFYNADPILTAEGDVRTARLALTGLVADVLQAGATILTLRLPERM